MNLGLVNRICIIQAVYRVLIIGEYNYECEPCDYTKTPKGMLLLNLTYYYFLLKVLDLFDTVNDTLYIFDSNNLKIILNIHSKISLVVHCAPKKGFSFVISPLLSSLFHGSWNIHW